jgi:hypothetical protein
MKSSICSFAIVVIFTGLALPVATVKARDADNEYLTFAVAKSSKQKRVNACRARYRDCVKLNQIPSSECQYIYQDCINHIY